jgi:Zn finger protein HypA/HybF involved in hydrogenase expression
VICPIDGNPVIRGKTYCSPECYHEAQRANRPTGLQACARCGKQFWRKTTENTKYCGDRCYEASLEPERFDRCTACGFDLAPIVTLWSDRLMCPNCIAIRLWIWSGHGVTVDTIRRLLEPSTGQAGKDDPSSAGLIGAVPEASARLHG